MSTETDHAHAALRRDCALKNVSPVSLDLKGNDLLAYKYLCLAPAPIVIKVNHSDFDRALIRERPLSY